MHIRVIVGEKQASVLRAELRQRGVLLNAYAEKLLGGLVVEREPREITLVLTSFAELGLTRGGTIEELASCASARGLRFATIEAGVLLRLEWNGDIEGERLTVVSPRASVDESEPRGFYVRRDGEGFWLRGYVASEDWRFEGRERIALVEG